MCWGGGGGGGRGYSPQLLVGMCRGKVKNGQGLRNGLPVERENMGLRNELEPFLSLKMRISGTSLIRFERENAYLRNGCRTLCVRAEPAVGGDERVQIKDILKMMFSGTAKSAKKCKMVMLRNGFFGNL